MLEPSQEQSAQLSESAGKRRTLEEVERVDVGPSDDVTSVDDLERDEIGMKNQRSWIGENDIESDPKIRT